MTPYPDPSDDEEHDGTWQGDHPPAPAESAIVPAPGNWVTRTRNLILKVWQPRALPPPRADRELTRLTPLERSAEVLRYTFHRTEHWLSPKGWLREWIRLNVRLASLLAIPAFLVGPLLGRLLAQVGAWITMMNNALSSMVLFPLSAVLVLGLIWLLLSLFRMMPFRRHPPGPQNYDQQRYY